MKRITYQSSKSIIDSETGQIIEDVTIKQQIVNNEPAYVKMYINDIVRLNNLPGASGKVLNVLVKNMSYANIVVLIKAIKDMILQETGLPINTINKSITQLTEVGILIRKERSVYIVDPTLFAKGKWEDIKKLQLIINYEKDGTKSMKSSLTQPEQLKLL